MSDATEQTINLVLGENDSAILTPQWFISGKYAPVAAGFAPLINGERAFATIAKAIEQAQKSIDIITWGFQSSMYFTRGSKDEAKRVGDLLVEAADRGVKVRILVWYTLGGIAKILTFRDGKLLLKTLVMVILLFIHQLRLLFTVLPVTSYHTKHLKIMNMTVSGIGRFQSRKEEKGISLSDIEN
ncbi:phospholipase D-like domain-containing protein [Providencia sp. PROV024]|uniref:phospholipase D-like domain-containing protein n=1 Tax=Providencia sp. PROV024 TaxID=2949758 RepID=UPI00234B2778|nr:hypothetical protein [Providencia sp. PROV024]WOC03528.1 hypothetical protein P3L56_17250 [Providencia sp. PROV024]